MVICLPNLHTVSIYRTVSNNLFYIRPISSLPFRRSHSTASAFFCHSELHIFLWFSVPEFSIEHTLHYWLAVVYTLCHKGQFHLNFLPLCTHELHVLPTTPFTPFIEGDRSGPPHVAKHAWHTEKKL